MISFKYIKIDQPYATFYLGKLKVSEIDSISFSNQRTIYNSEGIQRKLDLNRIRNIKEYASRPDAVFPTAIILSAPNEMVEIVDENFLNIDNESKELCSIIDGQHRIRGIMESSNGFEFEVPVVIFIESTLEIDAELFSTINGNQKPVSKSLVYDLYGLSSKRTVAKVTHEIIKALNTSKESRMTGKVKMLGIKDEENINAEVSQSTLADSLMSLISNRNIKNNIDYLPDIVNKQRYVFYDWYNENKEHLILKVVMNFFNAWIDARDEYFGDDRYKYFKKSIGYIVAFKLLRLFYLQGRLENQLSEEFFFGKISDLFNHYKNSEYSKQTYSSSQSGAKDLYDNLKSIAEKNELIKKQFN
ncbi:DGQHR domain-containing protein [Macrococcoides goetzii]|uniref:DGQHR domain-containing protein n=1 Tax=Macrococcoides goetzii TaxID=1891097 RepID=UPI000C578D48|nr:DGQHR domain-containing protein [Macrococcus goetzii]